MTWRDIELDPPRRKLREFAVLTGVLAAIWGVVLWHRGNLSTSKEILLAAAGFVSVAGLLAPAVVRWIYVGLMILTFPLAFTMNYLVLAAVFYLVLFPLALAFRLSGRDTLALKIRPGQSHWKPVTSKTPASYFRQH